MTDEQFDGKIDFVILAAGQGKRLAPITTGYPKAMVRILGKPLLEWIVEGALASFAGRVGKIVVVVGFEGERIRQNFASKPYSGKIEFVEQAQQKGTAHALAAASRAVTSESFFVLNGDAFFDPSVFDYLREQSGRGHFIIAKREHDTSSYGVIEKDEGDCLSGLVEKPRGSSDALVSTGTFFLPRSFFGLLEVPLSKRGEHELTDAVLSYAKGNKLRVAEFPGFWTDVGYFWNYLHACEYALERLMPESRQGTIEDFAVVKGKLHLGAGSVIKSGSYIEGNAYIGENCVIGPNAYLRKGVVVEDNCHIGNSTEIKASVIMRNSNAAHLSYIGDSIVCESVNFGAGTKIANLKFDHSSIAIDVAGKRVDSRRNKLGAVVGKGTKTGVNVSINCGIFIGENCRIFPSSYVYNNLPDNSVFRGNDSEKQ
ncbi:MAG: bifunctional sugar-1-phosphate nucleotidylyltransferase/acetyltransferase [Candidatus Micrarchaeota archaeon]